MRRGGWTSASSTPARITGKCYKKIDLFGREALPCIKEFGLACKRRHQNAEHLFDICWYAIQKEYRQGNHGVMHHRELVL